MLPLFLEQKVEVIGLLKHFIKHRQIRCCGSVYKRGHFELSHFLLTLYCMFLLE